MVESMVWHGIRVSRPFRSQNEAPGPPSPYPCAGQLRDGSADYRLPSQIDCGAETKKRKQTSLTVVHNGEIYRWRDTEWDREVIPDGRSVKQKGERWPEVECIKVTRSEGSLFTLSISTSETKQ